MSTQVPRPAPAGPHLDDEAASAALDDEATAAETTHLEACVACRQRVERLRAVQALVAAGAPVDTARRERVLAAAVAAFEPGPGEVTAQAASAPRHVGRRRHRRPVAPWLGVAAVVLLVVLAVPLLSSLGGDDGGGEAGTAVGEVTARSGGAEDRAAATAPAPAVDVGDLGPLSAGADLRPVVDRALGAVGDEAAGPAAGTGTDAAEEGAGGQGGGDAGDDEPSPQAAGGGAPEPTAAGPPPGGTAVCEAATRDQLPEAGALILTGTATVEGGPAVVHGFRAPTERPTVLVALVAVEGCRIVTFQSYAPG